MLVELGLLVVLLLVGIYRYVTQQFDYFQKRGVPFYKPSFPFGSPNSKKIILQTESMDKEIVDIFTHKPEFKKEKVFGYFSFGQPIWVINDEEISKRVLIKDFDHFTDIRDFYVDGNSKSAKINKHFMFNMKGEEWKKARSLVSGVFTGHKLKSMSFYMMTCAKNMEDYISEAVSQNQDLDIKSLTAKFALDAIATSGFGIDSNSFKEPNSMFRIQALKIMRDPEHSSQFDFARMIVAMVAPSIARLFGWQLIPNEPVLFFASIIEKTHAHRVKTGERREDIVDLLMDEMAAFEALASGNEKLDKETLLVSNALLFYLAGFDTTSMSLSIIIHALAMHPEVQDNVVAEIEQVLQDSDEITYDHIQAMKYMDKAMNEAFRHNSFFSQIERRCTKDYKVPGTDFVIEKGRYVSCYGRDLFQDKNHFKNPEEFDPENFAKENNPSKFAFQFFGQGPRGCVGMRYAYLVMKIALTFMLRKYRWVPCERSVPELEMDINAPFSGFKAGCWFKPELR